MSDPAQPFTVDVKRYLELEIEKKAAAKVDEYIREKRDFVFKAGRFLLPTLALLIFLVMGSVTYWQYTSISKLREDTQKAQASAATLALLTVQAKENLDQSSQLTKGATEILEDSFASMTDTTNAVTENTRQILASQDRLIQAQGQIISMQDRLRNDMEGEVKKATEQAGVVENIYGKLNKESEAAILRAQKVEQETSQVGTLAAQVASTHSKVLGEEGDLQNLIKLNSEIIRLRASETIWMRQETETEVINLPDLDNPGAPAFSIKLKVGDIKAKGTPLEYRVKLPQGGWWPDEQQWIRLGTIQDIPEQGERIRQAPMPVRGTPYEVKVEFVNHTKGRDFVALRIQPRSADAPLSEQRSVK